MTRSLLLIFLPIVATDIIKTYQIPLTNSAKDALGYPEDNLLDFPTLAAKNGYAGEEHSVTTEDGYILKLHRLLSRNCKEFIQPPVVLVHGLLLSSDTWLDIGPNASLAYLLADNCYDLWVGNVRGNYLGRRHVTLNPDKDPEFWEFSYHDMGLFDIPAIIDYVLNSTNSYKINYIGYSQGGSTFSIMCAERPGYCEKAGTFIGLAPASRMLYTRSVIFRLVSELLATFWKFLRTIGVYEVFFKGSIVQETLEYICKKPKVIFCQSVIAAVDAYDPGSISTSSLRRIYAHLPGGTSVKNFVAYSQAQVDSQFRKFNYGRAKNLKLYGNPVAPIYNLTKVNIPTLFLAGLNDFIVDPRDVAWFANQIPNARYKVVDRVTWTHFDIPYSSFIPEVLFPVVNNQLLDHSYRYQRFYKHSNLI